MPLASHGVPMICGRILSPSVAFVPGELYEICDIETAVTPLPTHIADIRSRSGSKHAQQSLPRLRISPRGVRLFVGIPLPSGRASSVEEKNGKLVSTKSAHVARLEARSRSLRSKSTAW